MSRLKPAYTYPDSCIAMFARAPVLGKVKTRLILALGEQGALDMHLRLMHRQLSVLNQSRLSPAQLWVDQNPEDIAFSSFRGDIKRQSDGNLGDKMHAATRDVLTSYAQVIIIGSDCPQLDENYLAQALSKLDEDSVDIVLGPALDGGYVLIGMKQPHHEIFQNIHWGSEFVLEQTISKIKDCDLKHFTLKPLRDIDTAEDLKLAFVDDDKLFAKV